jgi:hypothetical protein
VVEVLDGGSNVINGAGSVFVAFGCEDTARDVSKDVISGVKDSRYFPNESRECCLNATEQSLSV